MTDEPVYIANDWPFRDVYGGRVWHARNRGAELRHKLLAVSLCGTSLIGGSETVEGPFPPVGQNRKPCSRCLYLAEPLTLSWSGFQLLRWLSHSQPVTKFKSRLRQQAINTVMQRDLIEGDATSMRLSQLGWRVLAFCRQHPAFEQALNVNES